MLHQICRIGFLLPVFAVIRIAAQDRGAFAYLTPLFGIVAEAVDQNGNLYAVGSAPLSSNPAFGIPGITATPGAFQSPPKKCATPAGCLPVYVAKLDPSGHIVYTALIGGSDVQRVTGIAVDADGYAIITGYTYASDFPVTPGALQAAFGGGTYYVSIDGTAFVVPGGDAFVTKLNSTGSALIFSTFLGGSNEDWATSIALDPSGSIYVAGHSFSPNFPVTAGAYDQQRRLGEGDSPSLGNGFIARLKPDGSGFVFSTYFDVSVTALALGPDGAIYATGTATSSEPSFPATPGAFQARIGGDASAYAAELSPDGARLIFATLLGGSHQDTATSIAVLASGAVLVGGTTYSSDFPVVNAPPILSGQTFLATLSPDGSNLLSSYSPGGDDVRAIFTEPDGSIWISGSAFVNAYPLTPDGFQKGNGGSFAEHRDVSTQSLLYSTTIREGAAMALDRSGNVYIGGGLEAGKIDFSLVSTASVIAHVTNAGSYEWLAIAPGEIVAIFGERLGPAVGVQYTLDTQGRAPRSLGGVSVSFDGIPAPLIYAGATQINAIVPWELTVTTAAQVTVQYNGQVSAPFSARVANAVPGIFQTPEVTAPHVLDIFPHQAAVINEDGTANSPANPAPLGSIVSLYVTGLGPETPVPTDGSVTPDASHLAVNPISVMFFGGVPGQVLWAGGAPGFLAGVSQINVRLPRTLPTDTNQSAVNVFIRSGQSNMSNLGPTIAVRY